MSDQEVDYANVEQYNLALDTCEREVDDFLNCVRDVELTTLVDALAISIVIKARNTFADIRLLANYGRCANATGLQRAIWESLLLLKYAAHCTVDPEEFASALFLHDMWQRGETLKRNNVWPTIPETIRQEFDLASDQYSKLPKATKDQVKLGVKQKHDAVMAAESDALPRGTVNSVEVDQYDLVYRPASMELHGELPGTHSHVAKWLGGLVDQPSPLQRFGPAVAAGSWLSALVSTWADVTMNQAIKDGVSQAKKVM